MHRTWRFQLFLTDAVEKSFWGLNNFLTGTGAAILK